MLNVSRQASALGIVVIGQSVVILAGGIDLSVGSVLTLTNILAASLMAGRNEAILSVALLCLLVGAAIGAINGFGVTRLKIPPFVMTLCTMSVIQGVYLVYSGGSPTKGSAPEILREMGTGYALDVVPYATLMWIFLAFVVGFILRKSVFGRALYSVGGNARAARLCGISVNATRMVSYVISGMMASVAGLILTGYIGTGSFTIGADYVNNSLAAVLIGGNAIEGGRGSIWGPALGSFLMMLLFSLLTMLNLGQVGKLVAQGAIIFVVVALQGRKEQ
jgi:ribose/xylose/arabinose/galactoside ABC-type transport system permease subunit